MTESPTVLVAALDLPMPAKVASTPLDTIVAGSAAAFVGLRFHADDRPGIGALLLAVPPAERFLAACADQGPALRDAMTAMPEADITAELLRFVVAWPNASGGDLAGYGAQLLQDVVDRQPCRYAVREALRKLRHGSRFLPSIAEVLAALDEAQGRIRNTAYHIAELPQLLDRARVELADAERGAARHEARTAQPDGEPDAFRSAD